jgi:hypothetical protein
MERAIFDNQALQFLMHDLNDLFFGKSSLFTRSIFGNMREVIKQNKDYHENDRQIFESLDKDIRECQVTIDSYKHLQEGYDFCRNRAHGRKDAQISLEGGFDQEAWDKVRKF